MGWTFQSKNRGVTVKDFFQTEFNWSSGESKVNVLDCAVVGMRTAYLAVERTFEDKRIVYGMVCLLDYRNNDHYNFGYKDMEDNQNPYYYDCPKRILDLLTPTDNENALEWRRVCRENLAAREAKPKLKTGMYLKLNRSVTFSNGEILDTFLIHDAKLRQFRTHSYGYNYKLSKRILDRGFRVLTKEEVMAEIIKEGTESGIL